MRFEIGEMEYVFVGPRFEPKGDGGPARRRIGFDIITLQEMH